MYRLPRMVILAGAAIAGIGLTSCGDTDPVPPPVGPVDAAATTSAASSAPPDLGLPGPADLLLSVPEGSAEGSSVTTLEQQGTAAVDVQVATLAGGDIHVTTDREGSAAFQFPAYSSSGSPPLAVVRVTPDGDGGADPLAPGEADFLFGADFRQDAAPEDLISDYGANLMQRGLAGSEGQYKLQVDGGRPSCRIQGSDGAVKLDAGIRTEPHSWYRVRCSRRGDSVELRVIEYLPDGPARESIARGSGRIGSLTWAKTQTPLSVGGKLSSRGELKPDAPDQFNGVVSNPVLVIDD